jgi:hypothetical protein
MIPQISMPREALVELLKAAGSTMTPEEYLASLPDLTTYKKFPGRARMAALSKYSILVVAVAGVVLLPFLGFTFENIVITAGLVTVTFYEYRVHRFFRENNPLAPSLGFRNQSAFAAAILIYCLYHAFAPFQLPLAEQNMMEENNVIDPNMLKGMVRTFYLFIGVIVGGSQFALAWYYRNAESKSL